MRDLPVTDVRVLLDKGKTVIVLPESGSIYVKSLAELGQMFGGIGKSAALDIARQPGFPARRLVSDTKRYWFKPDVLAWMAERQAV